MFPQVGPSQGRCVGFSVCSCSERDTALGREAAVRLQQRGLVRRRDRAHNLELTDDVRSALPLDGSTQPANY